VILPQQILNLNGTDPRLLIKFVLMKKFNKFLILECVYLRSIQFYCSLAGDPIRRKESEYLLRKFSL